MNQRKRPRIKPVVWWALSYAFDEGHRWLVPGYISKTSRGLWKGVARENHTDPSWVAFIQKELKAKAVRVKLTPVSALSNKSIKNPRRRARNT